MVFSDSINVRASTFCKNMQSNSTCSSERFFLVLLGILLFMKIPFRSRPVIFMTLFRSRKIYSVNFTGTLQLIQDETLQFVNIICGRARSPLWPYRLSLRRKRSTALNVLFYCKSVKRSKRFDFKINKEDH